MLCYVDNTILIHPEDKLINNIIQELCKLKYDLSYEGELEDYLGICIERLCNGWLKMSQPQLIQQILQDLGLCSHANVNHKYMPKTLQTLATSTITLTKNLDGPVHNEKWNYHLVIGKNNFLEKSTQPELANAVHNAVRFLANPRQSYSQVVKWIGQYLLGTQDKGIIMTPDLNKGLEVFTNADCCGLFDPETALYDPVTAKSRTGYIIKYMGCPIVWVSKL